MVKYLTIGAAVGALVIVLGKVVSKKSKTEIKKRLAPFVNGKYRQSTLLLYVLLTINVNYLEKRRLKK